MSPDDPGTSPTAHLDQLQLETVLEHGELDLEGRLLSASNASFYGTATLDGVTVQCIYKPVQGERPLWDFPDGTLADRERAARLVSAAGGWDVVPPTVLRDGRFGPGMCQRWVDVTDDEELVDVLPIRRRTDGWIAVVQAEDERGRPVVLVHRDDDRLRTMAVLDVVINNADRKGGHVLLDSAGHVWGCDHGVTFHVEPKLRTVLWGWAGEPLRAVDEDRLEQLTGALRDGLELELCGLLTSAEVGALKSRLARLRRRATMPRPDGSWRAIPWPAF